MTFEFAVEVVVVAAVVDWMSFQLENLSCVDMVKQHDSNQHCRAHLDECWVTDVAFVAAAMGLKVVVVDSVVESLENFAVEEQVAF